jgi:hypothetical protein
LEWGRKVEHQDVRRVVGHDSVNVLGTECFRPAIHELANLGLIGCFTIVCRHDRLLYADFVVERRCSLSRIISVKFSAGRISKGPAFTPECLDINWIA